MNFVQTFSASLLLIINTLHSGVSADTGICYGSLGCFNITDDFKSIIYRPINLLPESPERIDTKFIHFSRNNRKTGKVFDRKWFTSDKVSDKLGDFDGSKEAKFIIHGYLDNLDVGKWMLTLKDELLTKGDFNVFIVDWSSGNGKIPSLLNYMKLKFFIYDLLILRQRDALFSGFSQLSSRGLTDCTPFA